MLVVRPAMSEDIDAICMLADLAGAGFTSLEVGREALERRLAKRGTKICRNGLTI